jgi:hypothetical protein
MFPCYGGILRKDQFLGGCPPSGDENIVEIRLKRIRLSAGQDADSTSGTTWQQAQEWNLS